LTALRRTPARSLPFGGPALTFFVALGPLAFLALVLPLLALDVHGRADHLSGPIFLIQAGQGKILFFLNDFSFRPDASVSPPGASSQPSAPRD
jgi:hypothetical protein